MGRLLPPPPPPPTKGPVSGWEGFSADLGHCSFWVIGRPTWNWKGEASRAAHSSYPGAGTGRLERRMGLPPVEVSEQQMGGSARQRVASGDLCFLGCPAQGEESALLSEK